MKLYDKDDANTLMYSYMELMEELVNAQARDMSKIIDFKKEFDGYYDAYMYYAKLIKELEDKDG